MLKVYKLSILSAICLFSLFIGHTTYAEDTDVQPVACTMDVKVCPDGSFVSRIPPNCEFAKCPSTKKEETPEELRKRVQAIKDEIDANREKTEALKDDYKNQVQTVKDDLAANKIQYRAEIQSLIDSVKQKRQEYFSELGAEKEAARTKIEEMKSTLKANLAKIKDSNKRTSAEKIVSTITYSNSLATEQFYAKLAQIENVLLSIESRIVKAKDRGLDVTTVESQVSTAKTAIDQARKAIKTQAAKTYNVNITDEATLKSVLKTLRDNYASDIKAVREKVKEAHVAVKTVATTLAQIPKIDDDTTTTNNEVEQEDNDTNN